MHKGSFTLVSAMLLGIGSMVGAGIFIVIGQAGALAGSLVWVSFIFGAFIALLSGYSLAKLAIAFPSRGGIVEYLVQGFGENIFSGTLGILFYFSQLIAIAAVAKSFGVYASALLGVVQEGTQNLFAVGVVALFTLINLVGATVVAKSESLIVGIKLAVLVLFACIALFSVQSDLLLPQQMPPISGMLYAIGLTFFAYQGFSVITNTVEDMQNPKQTLLRAMLYAITFVALLYVVVSIAVMGNLTLAQITQAKEYALAQAAVGFFGQTGFNIMAVTALLATASAINATLYATTEIGYTLAKEGELPKVYEYHLYNSFEGLIVSAMLIVPMMLFFDLSQITTQAAIIILLVQGVTHIAHLRCLAKSGAHKWVIVLAVVLMFTVALLLIYHSYVHDSASVLLLVAAFVLAFVVEVLLRRISNRSIKRAL